MVLQGAFSQESFTGSGAVPTTAAQTNKYNVLGLSAKPGDSGFSSIEYALYQYAGMIRVFENSVNRGSFGDYRVGDELSVERLADGTVQYLKNGTVFYTSTLNSDPATALYADVSFYHHGSRMNDTVLTSGSGPVDPVSWIYDSGLVLAGIDGPVTTTHHDLNGDGVADAVLTSGDGSIWTRLGDGQGGFGEANQLNGQESGHTFEFVNGTTGNHTLSGSGNAEFLSGGADDDILSGAGGSDILCGGSGSDTFVFTSAGASNDTVKDFETSGAEADVLQFESAVFAEFNAVLAAAVDDGTDTTITLDEDTFVVLKSVLVSSLQSDDFVFV